MEAFVGCGGVVKALNTHTYGNGSETIVLSHGYGSTQDVWHYLIPALAYYFKVLVYDLVISPNVNPKLYDPLRYSNFSAYAQDLICILDELNVRNSVFVGHFMSAMIGCIAAKQRPDLFQHLVLLAGSPRYLNEDETGYDGGFSRVELDSLFDSIKSDFSGWVKSFVPKAIGVNDTAAIAAFEGSLGRMKPETALTAVRSVFLTDNRDILPGVHVPSTIIQSEKDIIVPESVAFYMKTRVDAPAKVIILKTQGHFPQLTVPYLLLRVLKQILGIKG
ncbi:Sigma factor SigB regulation protein RsbQ [Sesamum alatum]|uniref:Sigma factor SigB regulation protein RsbQ n=1 Tax=Sesamum alatum TaxID=300844 RepID=A0AAE2C8L5_9LAMI|nr:Sigma factor SigB regulation protein RsbQ [Sesamum alatum]